MKITIILCMISISVYASRSWAQQESAWALSANPVSISYVPKAVSYTHLTLPTIA